MHCFRCGYNFRNKGEVKRVNGLPYCDECEGIYYQNQAAMEYEDYEMMKWTENHPNEDYDQWRIDQANIAKYGEC